MAAQPRRRFKIEPFKHKMEVDKGYADQTWSKLESAIKEINNHKTSGLSFEEVRGKRVFGVECQVSDSRHRGGNGCSTSCADDSGVDIVPFPRMSAPPTKMTNCDNATDTNSAVP